MAETDTQTIKIVAEDGYQVTLKRPQPTTSGTIVTESGFQTRIPLSISGKEDPEAPAEREQSRK